jgi:flagellar hook-associated protein 3 FlgL
MRISFNMQSEESLQALNDQQDTIYQISQQLSSGQKLSSPSDDPYAWAQAMNIQQGVREYNSILNNINFATGWQQATDSALNQLSNLVSQAQQTAISANSATGTSQSAALASQLSGILQQALDMANSQYENQYVFAGTNTGSAPFSIDSSGNVTYSGNSNYINVRTDVNGISADNTTVNLTGTDLTSFTSGGQTLNVLQEISGLEQAVKNGDSATISSKIQTLSDAFNHINDELTINGARLSTLDSQKSAIGVFQTNAQQDLSNLQDTDIAAATTQLQQAQTAFEAALKVAGILSNLNLASFLTASSTTP